MTRELFDLLLALVRDKLTKLRQRIGPEERVAITLLYLGHGCSLQSIAWSHKLGKLTVRGIVLQTCEVLWRTLSPIYLSEPTTQQYKDIEKDFNSMWNAPNCVGAIDGKHVGIKNPPNSGSMFYNYKKHFSLVLLGVCDAKYTFTSVSVGSFGSQSDSGIFRLSPFGESVMTGNVPVPPHKPLSASTDDPFPHYFIGDADFPLRNNLMRPGSNLDTKKAIYNYRLSRARRVIENSFGILCVRWRILLTTIEMAPENVDVVVLACTALHNFIMLNDQKRWYCPEGYVDREAKDGTVQEGEWRKHLRNSAERPMRSFATNIRRSTQTAMDLRDRLADYFCNEGVLPFQYRMI
ncbi:protein ANTAGONIST OF LIKE HETEROCHROMATIN PROTEIN 1-like [Lucilia sericata]|uniref:protein ANTAGONIST OF LIKE HETEROCHROMATIN PROTEIN 1-like n=1 Tax=Lucilia sericata TaxID=13632 RepID=UPI0018A84326|nr:protein ANTAGONIST OF LIKE HETEROCHROMATIN PROTEIN 1-like [Lucilia sericata]